MKIVVLINSYKRADMVETLGTFPDAKICVHEFEVEEYKKLNPKSDIVAIPDSMRGNLPKVKNFLLDSFLPKYDAVLILDDDIKDVGYFEEKKRKIVGKEDAMAFIEKYTILCKDWGYKLW